jgi:two-component system response regulator RegX3
VLVVEDEESFSDALSYMLRKEGFEVAVCPTGPDAIETFDREGADLVLLDLMLPGLPGSEVCRTLRERSTVPVIMLTAKDSEIDKVVGLELGADDYVTKPFSSRELVARMRAVLRRRGEPEEQGIATLESGPVRMDVDRHVVTVRSDQIQLPLKEFELLEVLLRNAGRVLTRMQLIDRVWGADYVGDTKTLDVHIKRLRAKVEIDPGNPPPALGSLERGLTNQPGGDALRPPAARRADRAPYAAHGRGGRRGAGQRPRSLPRGRSGRTRA